MSWVEVRERCLDSPARARSFWTVLAAISSARRSELPRCFWLRLIFSYWRARLVPFLIPRGGISTPPGVAFSRTPLPSAMQEKRPPSRAMHAPRHLGQLALQDLARGVSRQRVEELHVAGDLVASEIRLPAALDVVLGEVGALVENHECL